MLRLTFTIENTHQDVQELQHLLALLPVAEGGEGHLVELWNRIGNDARSFLVTCAAIQLGNPEGSFTLAEVAAMCNENIATVRSRKMTLGRSEKAAGVSLFYGRYDNSEKHQMVYQMDLETCQHIHRMSI